VCIKIRLLAFYWYLSSHPQLSAIFNNYTSQGFYVIDVPSNTFAQEPFSNAQLIQYAANNSYLFPFLAKTNVNGACALKPGYTMDQQCGLASTDCCPENVGIYTYMKSVLPGPISWNYGEPSHTFIC
jgi:glutathione peroxidase-family protein